MLWPPHYFLTELKHKAPEHQPASLRSVPQTLKSQLSSAPGPSQSFIAFQMLFSYPAPALQRRIAGSTLRLTACVHEKAKSCVLKHPRFPGLPSFRLPICWDKVEERVGSLCSDRWMHVQPSWRMESLWLWGFGPSPILGVAVKAKQCSLK